MAKRKYNPVYLKCRFSFIEDNKGPKPQCVICREVLANERMKPSKLKCHLDTKHPACTRQAGGVFSKTTPEAENFTEVSDSDLLQTRGSSPCLLPRSSPCCEGEETPHNSRRAYLTYSHGYGERGDGSISSRQAENHTAVQ